MEVLTCFYPACRDAILRLLSYRQMGAGSVMLELINLFRKEVRFHVMGNGSSPRHLRNYPYHRCTPSSSFWLVRLQVGNFRVGPGTLFYFLRDTVGESKPEASAGCGIRLDSGHSRRPHDQSSAEHDGDRQGREFVFPGNSVVADGLRGIGAGLQQ